MTVSVKERFNVTLPTRKELATAEKALVRVQEPLTDIAWRVERVGGIDEDESSALKRRKGDEVPTFEHIGRLYSFVLDDRASLAELNRLVTRVEDRLRDLDYVRLREEAE
jgi:hypothetical protein